MRDLEILFIEDVDKVLSYPIHELEKDKSGYYKLNHTSNDIRQNFKEYVKKREHKYCFVINLENKILKHIYNDKVYTLKQVVENLYEFKDIEKTIDKPKSLTKKLDIPK